MRRHVFAGVLTISIGVSGPFTIPALANDFTDCNSSDTQTRIAGCTRIIENADEHTPKNVAGAYNNRGQVFDRLGQSNRAIADYTQAIKIDSTTADAWNNRALIWDKMGDYDRAISDYKQALQLRPNNWQYLTNRGAAYHHAGQNENAIADLDQAIRINPRHATAYNYRGSAYGALGQYDRAIADFDEQVKLEPRNATGWNNRGLAWSSKGNLDRALADYDRAIQLRLNDAAFLLNRALLLQDKGDLDRAIDDFGKAIAGEPKFAPAYSSRGLAWRAKGNVERAVADYNEAIRLNPKLADPYVGRGLAYESGRETERAKADYEMAVSLPKDIALHSQRFGFRSWHASSSALEVARARLTILSQGDRGAPGSSPTPKDSVPKLQSVDVGRRVALVIGNGAYANATSLANPANDSREVARILRGLGLEVSEGIDLDHTALQATLAKFLREVATARVAVIFYAGHGIQIDGRNYLLPIDAKLDGTGLESEITAVDTILLGLDDQIRTNIVILDACRDNPFAQQLVAQNPSRAAKVRAGLVAPSELGAGATYGAGTLLAFSTAPGKVALDGEGANSPFTTALVRHMPTPGLEVQSMLTRVRAEVVAATKNQQVPWSNSSLLGEVYLVR